MKAITIAFDKFKEAADKVRKINPVAAIIIVPLCVLAVFAYHIAWYFGLIWGLNTLFGLKIEYTLLNCFAVYLVTFPLKSISSRLASILLILEERA